MSHQKKESTKILLVLFLVVAFRSLFAFGFGFIRSFDEQVIYTLGLKFYTTQTWPFFGPDVVYTQSQIPGALQGLLVGLPFFLLPIPEAPFILLLILTFISLAFISWYFTKLDFNLPAWFIYLWIFTLPWSIFWSSMLMNPAYVLVYSAFFFVALIESIRVASKTTLSLPKPSTCQPIISLNKCFFMMGFSILSIIQLHLSWVLLPPFVIALFLLLCIKLKPNLKTARNWIGFFLLGALVGGSTLIPTLIKYRYLSSGRIEDNIIINWDNYATLYRTIGQFLYYASYEVMTYFNELANHKIRYNFVSKYPWSLPAFAYSTFFGHLQLVVYGLGLFTLKRLKNKQWLPVRGIMVFAILLTWASFFFNNSGNMAHKYILFIPLSAYYSLFVVEWVAEKKWKISRYLYGLALTSLFLTHLAWAINHMYHSEIPELYYKNRSQITRALQEKNYRIYGSTRYDLRQDKKKDNETEHSEQKYSDEQPLGY